MDLIGLYLILNWRLEIFDEDVNLNENVLKTMASV